MPLIFQEQYPLPCFDPNLMAGLNGFDVGRQTDPISPIHGSLSSGMRLGSPERTYRAYALHGSAMGGPQPNRPLPLTLMIAEHNGAVAMHGPHHLMGYDDSFALPTQSVHSAPVFQNNTLDAAALDFTTPHSYSMNQTSFFPVHNEHAYGQLSISNNAVATPANLADRSFVTTPMTAIEQSLWEQHDHSFHPLRPGHHGLSPSQGCDSNQPPPNESNTANRWPSKLRHSSRVSPALIQFFLLASHYSLAHDAGRGGSGKARIGRFLRNRYGRDTVH